MSINGLTALLPLFKKNWLTACELPRGVKADALAALDAVDSLPDSSTLDGCATLRLRGALSRVITPGEVPQLRADLGRLINRWRAAQ